LAILEARAAGRDATSEQWSRLFTTEGYLRLKARETKVVGAFSDSSFTAFVRSDTVARRSGELRGALAEWTSADLSAAAERALAYLPADATIRATVYVVIKPGRNSFVWDLSSAPAIFLYLNPRITRAQFENTVAHELHHVGFSSVGARTDSLLAGLPDSVRAAAQWLGAFGEGFAMLAAAGGPDVHPHAASTPEDRARWDRDMANANRDLGTLERFFIDVMTRRLATPDTIEAVAGTFFGIQGPWYTVGWKMAVVVERRFGRDMLIEAMVNPPLLLAQYNRAAREYNRTHADTLALWSPELLRAFGVEPEPSEGGCH
jgi:hypothetical protein